VARRRLCAALLLLGLSALVWLGGWSALGADDGSPYPPPTPGGDRPVIASGQPIASTAPPVVQMSGDAPPSLPGLPKPRPLPPDFDSTVPPVPRPKGVEPVVPIPDDGLTMRRRFRKLPPPRQYEEVSAPPEIGPASQREPEPMVIRPESAPRPVAPAVRPEIKLVGAPPLPAPADHLTSVIPTPVVDRLESPELPSGPPVLPGAQTAILNLEIAGPPSINRGLPLAYEIVLRNNGTTPAHQVQVEETLQAGVRCLGALPQPAVHGSSLSWNLGTLAPGAERRLRLEVQPPGDGEVVSSAHATFTTGSSLRTRITQPQLTLTQSAPAEAQVGDDVVVQLKVTNTGTGPASHVVVQDQLPPGLRHPAGRNVEADVGVLAAGESKTLTLRAQADQAGKHVNEATVTADDCAAVGARGVVNVTQAVLSVRETSPRHGLVDQEMEYRVEVANTGSATATNVRVEDVLPPGLDYVSSSDDGAYAAQTRTVSWSVGALPPGQTRSVAFRAQAHTGGDYVHEVRATGDRGLEAKAAGAVRTQGVAALAVGLAASDQLVEVQGDTTYEIRVVNQGSGPSTNVRMDVLVPDGLAFVDAEGPAAHHAQGAQVAIGPIAQLPPRGVALFRVRCQGRKSGDWRFRVQVSSDQQQRPVSKEESTRVYE
jgi:uncharacterized repeat protein (TIGR01451 family)